MVFGLDVCGIHSICSIYDVFRLVVFGVFRVSVVLMGRWGWTLVAFTAFVVSGLSESFEVDG